MPGYTSTPNWPPHPDGWFNVRNGSTTMHTLLAGDPALARYDHLIDALGFEPEEAYSKAVLARLVAWSTEADVHQLAYLIRYARGRSAGRFRDLLRAIADHPGLILPETIRERLRTFDRSAAS
jgi:hypothetical protein